MDDEQAGEQTDQHVGMFADDEHSDGHYDDERADTHTCVHARDCVHVRGCAHAWACARACAYVCMCMCVCLLCVSVCLHMVVVAWCTRQHGAVATLCSVMLRCTTLRYVYAYVHMYDYVAAAAAAAAHDCDGDWSAGRSPIYARRLAVVGGPSGELSIRRAPLSSSV